MTEAQATLFEQMTGSTPGFIYFLIGGMVISLFGILMLKIGKGTLQGFSNGNVSGYEVLGRAARLAFLFNLLLFLVAPDIIPGG